MNRCIYKELLKKDKFSTFNDEDFKAFCSSQYYDVIVEQYRVDIDFLSKWIVASKAQVASLGVQYTSVDISQNEPDPISQTTNIRIKDLDKEIKNIFKTLIKNFPRKEKLSGQSRELLLRVIFYVKCVHDCQLLFVHHNQSNRNRHFQWSSCTAFLGALKEETLMELILTKQITPECVFSQENEEVGA